MTPTQTLEYQLALLEEEGITTAEQLAQHLNAKNSDTLVEDAQSWAGKGIHTARELAVHLDMSSFSDLYKEENGVRPRGFDYNEAMHWVDRHFGVD